jgi:cathepsin X
MSKNQITDETCSIYQAIGHTNGQQCSAMEMCRNCSPDEACTVPPKYRVYQVDEYGTVSGEQNMMQEIIQRGPIACGLDSDQLHDYTGGIACYSGFWVQNHIVSVVGWGEEDG